MNRCVCYDNDRQLTQSTLSRQQRQQQPSSPHRPKQQPFQLQSGSTGSRFAVLETENNDHFDVADVVPNARHSQQDTNSEIMASSSSSSSSTRLEIRPPYQPILSRSAVAADHNDSAYRSASEQLPQTNKPEDDRLIDELTKLSFRKQDVVRAIYRFCCNVRSIIRRY